MASLWNEEISEALRGLLTEQGLSSAQAAFVLNERFGTSFTRNSIIGRSHRLGLGIKDKPKAVKIARPKVSKERVSVAKIRQNGGGGLKLIHSTAFAEMAALRCIEIIPLNLTFEQLGSNDCRYPYGDSDFRFCGHAKGAASSYCPGHKALTWQESKPLRDRAFVREAA